MTSRVYRILVRHTRPGGLRYRFGYRLFNVCLALEDLDRSGGPRLFSHNRPNLVSFTTAITAHATARRRGCGSRRCWPSTASF